MTMHLVLPLTSELMVKPDASRTKFMPLGSFQLAAERGIAIMGRYTLLVFTERDDE